MRNSFGEVHDRFDRTNFRLDEHIKDSNHRFDQIESQMKTFKCDLQRIKYDVVQEIKRDVVRDLKRELREEITKSVNESMVSTFGRYFVHVEKMLDNHEERIRTLETHKGS